MDFGNFPGPERIPREAVTRGCCIITSRTGCAGNSVDVPIPEQYKYESSDENISKIISTIERMMSQYTSLIPEYKEYKDKVELQKVMFENGINIFLKHHTIKHKYKNPEDDIIQCIN